jgi:hypothetical protein
MSTHIQSQLLETEPVGYFQSEDGSKSMMRLLAFCGFLLGGVIVLPGIIIFILGAIQSVPVDNTGAVTLVGIGAGLAGGGEAMKMIQKKFEQKAPLPTVIQGAVGQ